MKKLIIIIGSLVVLAGIGATILFTLVFPFRLTTEVIDANVLDVLIVPQKEITSVIRNDLGTHVVLSSQLSCGLLTVQDASMHKGVWSLSKNDLIIPFAENVSITYQTDTRLGCYVRVTELSGEYGTHDVNGNVVLAKDDYFSSSILTSKEDILDDDGIIIETKYFETVSYLKQTDFDDGITDSTIVLYEVDVINQTRAAVEQDDSLDYGDLFSFDFFGFKLDKYGLPGHSITSAANVYTVYKTADNSVVSSFIIPTLNVTSTIMFDGKIIYQVNYQVDNSEEEYTYIEPGVTPKKYIMKTISVDLKTGKETTLDFNYKIKAFQPFSNSKGIFTHALVSVNLITSKMLSTEIDHDFIINTRGKLLADVTIMQFADLERLDEKYIYNSDSKSILDNDLNVVTKLPEIVTFVYTEKIVIFQYNGFFGAIDYEGNVVISFVHDFISLNFVNGKSYAQTTAGGFYGIDLENNTYPLVGDLTYITTGAILLRDTALNATLRYDASIVGYAGNIYQSFEMDNTFIHNTIQVDHAYISQTIVRIVEDGNSVYFAIIKEEA